MTEKNLLIASTLRLFAISHRVQEVWISLEEDFDGSVAQKMYLEPKVITPPEEDPFFEVSRGEPVEIDEGHDLSAMLQDIVRIVQDLLLQGGPQDWPVVFCVLGILSLVKSALRPLKPLKPLKPFDNYIHGFDRSDEVDEIWEDLCELYLACSRQCDPLVDDWNSAEYEALVGEGSHLLEYFETINADWVNEGTYETPLVILFSNSAPGYKASKHKNKLAAKM